MSNHPALESHLRTLSSDALVDLLLGLADKYTAVNNHLAVMTVPLEILAPFVVEAINELNNIHTRSRFVTDDDILDALLDIIAGIERLGTKNPDRAFELLTCLLPLNGLLLERATDEGCDIAIVFREDLPLIAARLAPMCTITTRVADLVLGICRNDALVASEDFIRAVAPTLPAETIQLILSQLEPLMQEVKQNSAGNDNTYRSYYKCFALALGNADDFAQLLADEEHPSNEDLLALCELYCDKEDFVSAAAWFARGEQVHWHYRFNSKKTNIRILLGLGRTDEVYAIYRKSFLSYPSESTFDDVQRHCGLDAVNTLVSELLDSVRNSANPKDYALEFLISRGYVSEVAHIMTQMDTSSSVSYVTYSRIAESLTEHKEWLAATVAYRLLLNDILDTSRSRAYDHGARYLESLHAISRHIIDWGALPSHTEYVHALQQLHKKKNAFWERFRVLPL
jgi:hypothetical protein